MQFFCNWASICALIFEIGRPSLRAGTLYLRHAHDLLGRKQNRERLGDKLFCLRHLSFPSCVGRTHLLGIAADRQLKPVLSPQRTGLAVMVPFLPAGSLARGRLVKRLLWVGGLALFYSFFIAPKSSPDDAPEIRTHGVLDYVKRSDKVLDVQRHDFLQVRMGRDERDDLLGHVVRDGVKDYWERFQKP